MDQTKLPTALHHGLIGTPGEIGPCSECFTQQTCSTIPPTIDWKLVISWAAFWERQEKVARFFLLSFFPLVPYCKSLYLRLRIPNEKQQMRHSNFKMTVPNKASEVSLLSFKGRHFNEWWLGQRDQTIVLIPVGLWVVWTCYTILWNGAIPLKDPLEVGSHQAQVDHNSTASQHLDLRSQATMGCSGNDQQDWLIVTHQWDFMPGNNRNSLRM